jgi:hypothetical protein
MLVEYEGPKGRMDRAWLKLRDGERERNWEFCAQVPAQSTRWMDPVLFLPPICWVSWGHPGFLVIYLPSSKMKMVKPDLRMHHVSREDEIINLEVLWKVKSTLQM